MMDFEGDMDVFQKQLTAAGISAQEFDITNFAGCTERELQWLVDTEIQKRKEKK